MKYKGKIEKALDKSPINYFSDLFIVAMVLAWIIVLIIMIGIAIYSTVVMCDNSIWPDVANLVGIPLSAGGAIWMIKNSVQHAIAYSRGERAHMDFPAVYAEGQDDGIEEPMEVAGEASESVTEVSEKEEQEGEILG